MSSISGISNSISRSYERVSESLSSGKRINKSADDAAGLAIAEKQDAQIKGYEKGTNNMASAKDAINIADQALGSITDYLQRIRELSVSAANTATVTDSDRQAMQDEVNQLIDGIKDVAKTTNYNTIPLLDGSKSNFRLATDGNGNSTSIDMANATLEALGIKDFDLTKDFSIDTIDDAISKVNSARSRMGAQSNGLDYAMNYTKGAAFYTTQSKSRIEDLDFPKAISEQKKNQTLLQYSLLMQKKKIENEEKRLAKLFS